MTIVDVAFSLPPLPPYPPAWVLDPKPHFLIAGTGILIGLKTLELGILVRLPSFDALGGDSGLPRRVFGQRPPSRNPSMGFWTELMLRFLSSLLAIALKPSPRVEIIRLGRSGTISGRGGTFSLNPPTPFLCFLRTHSSFQSVSACEEVS